MVTLPWNKIYKPDAISGLPVWIGCMAKRSPATKHGKWAGRKTYDKVTTSQHTALCRKTFTRWYPNGFNSPKK